MLVLVSGCGGDEDSGEGTREEAQTVHGGQDEPRGAATGGETGMAAGGEKPEAVKALYVPAGFVAEGEGLSGVLRIAEETEVNALVVDVKDAGSTTCPSEVHKGVIGNLSEAP